MTIATAQPLTDGTLVLRIDQADEKANPVKTMEDEDGRPGVVFHGGVLVMITTWDRIAPADKVKLEDVIVGVETRKWIEAVYPYQRKLWILNVRGTHVGTFDTKREALAASRVASAVLAYHGK
jgi:ribosomal protein S4E